jgi:hypothetical protein
MDEPHFLDTVTGCERHPEPVEDEVGTRLVGALPADDLPAEASSTNAKNATPSQQRR